MSYTIEEGDATPNRIHWGDIDIELDPPLPVTATVTITIRHGLIPDTYVVKRCPECLVFTNVVTMTEAVTTDKDGRQISVKRSIIFDETTRPDTFDETTRPDDT